MPTGRYGLNLKWLGAIAFIFGLIGRLDLLFLMVGFAVILEKSEAFTRTTLSAFVLRLLVDILSVVVNGFTGFLRSFSRDYDYYSSGFVSGISWFNSILWSLIYAAFIAFSVIALVQLLGNKPVRLPLVSNLVDLLLGIVRPKPVAQPAPPQQPGTPQQPGATPPAYPYAQPQGTPPAHQPYPAPVTPPAQAAPEGPAQPHTPAAPAPQPQQPQMPGNWNCVCGQENGGKFCVRCGSPRP